MAAGHPDAQPTKVAKAAIERLIKREATTESRLPVRATSFERSAEHAAVPDKRQLELCWNDLENDETQAARAVLELADQREQAVDVLKSKLKPLAITSGQVKALLFKLGSDNGQVWKPAFEELEYFDPRLAIEITDLMDRVTEAPARQRMVEVLSGRVAGSLKDQKIELHAARNNDYYYFVCGPGSWMAEHKVAHLNADRWATYKKKWVRAVRAILVLEQIGTPDAFAVIKDMTTGHPDAQPTRAAQQALMRLASTK